MLVMRYLLTLTRARGGCAGADVSLGKFLER